MSNFRALLLSVSSRALVPLRAVLLAGVAGVMVAAMLALALVAAPTFGAASAAAHHGNAVQLMVADGPNSVCPPSTIPCP